MPVTKAVIKIGLSRFIKPRTAHKGAIKSETHR